MPKPRLIDRDPMTGVSSWFHVGSDGEYHVVDVQDVNPLLEENQAMRNQTDERARYGNKHTYHLEASIPVIWMPELMAKTSNFKDKKELRRLLNDKRYRHLRTTNRRL